MKKFLVAILTILSVCFFAVGFTDCKEEHACVKGEWVIVKDCTETEYGSYQQKCTVCGDYLGQEIKTTPLVYTLNDDGKSYSVTDCNVSDSAVIIQPTFKELPVTSIGALAFYNCESLQSVEIPNCIASIDIGAFYDCSSLQYNEKDGLKYLGNNENKYIYLAGVTSTDITTATVESSCKFIAEEVFYNCRMLQSIEIPNGVVSIGDGAFSGCKLLESITIPNSVTSIGIYAFGGCDSLKYNEKDGLKYLGNNENKYIYLAGVTSTDITTATVESSCKFIAEEVFYNCRMLQSIEIPNGVVSIGDDAFSGCRALQYNEKDGLKYLGNDTNKYIYLAGVISEDITTATIENTCKFIGEKACYGCELLQSIKIPNGVTSIGSYAFYDCLSLETIEIPNGVTSIGSYTFRNCSSLESVSIPNSITRIGNCTFQNCSSLQSIEMSNSVISIGMSAFAGCSSLQSITIPKKVFDIGRSAFGGCDSLISIVIPSSVIYMELNVFPNCDSLVTIYCEAESQPSGWDSEWNENCGANVVWGFVGYKEEHEHNASDWVICKRATCAEKGLKYKGCTVCKEILQTETIEKLPHIESEWLIGTEATCENAGSKHVECTVCKEILQTETIEKLPHVESDWLIDTEATCENAGSKHIECTVCKEILQTETIEKRNHNIQCVVIEDCTETEHGTMQKKCIGCSNYNEEEIETTPLVYTLNEDEKSYSVTGYNVSDSTVVIQPTFNGLPVTSIDMAVFASCESLQGVTIPNSITSIGEAAFALCPSLTTIIVEEGNTAYKSIDGNLYSKDGKTLKQYAIGKAATIFEIPDGVTSVGGYYAFSGCSLTQIIIPNSVISIGDCAFAYCESLQSIEIPNSVTSIGNSAFFGCSSLQSIEIPNSVTSIGERAFTYCDSLETIYCEAESQPSGWDSGWKDYCNAEVIWGYTGE